MMDPLGLTRCGTCTNAFAYDRGDNGRCLVCFAAIWATMTDNEKAGVPFGLFPSWVAAYKLTAAEHAALMRMAAP